jgi:hypothetical protein
MEEQTVSRETIDDDVARGETALTGAVILSGSDRPRIGTVYDNASDAEVVKSLRLPTSLYNAAQQKQHPQGFSGVVRDALRAYLEEPSGEDVQHALTVIRAALEHRSAA